MKKLSFWLTIIVVCAIAILAASCTNESNQILNNLDQNKTFNYKVVVIDSCEYIMYRSYGYLEVTHKGNCKFCAERNKVK